mmetsp:Transcript_17745/g.32215  ORF Transcript_17745/g.32215 Transcript_17745/m.32215 type:complete len:151 (+) Transcript_17745:615-1067(+)
MIDPTTKRVPVLQRLIATTKTVPTREVYELFYRTFNELMNYSYQHGFRFIPDDVFIAAGFPADKDKKGNIKIKTQGISQENQLRAMCLTGDAQIASRAKRDADIASKIKQKEVKEKSTCDKKRSEDQAKVDKLCALAGLEISEDATFLFI